MPSVVRVRGYDEDELEEWVPKVEQLAALLPDVFFTLSSDVAPQIREYARASTTAVNASTSDAKKAY